MSSSQSRPQNQSDEAIGPPPELLAQAVAAAAADSDNDDDEQRGQGESRRSKAGRPSNASSSRAPDAPAGIGRTYVIIIVHSGLRKLTISLVQA